MFSEFLHISSAGPLAHEKSQSFKRTHTYHRAARQLSTVANKVVAGSSRLSAAAGVTELRKTRRNSGIRLVGALGRTPLTGMTASDLLASLKLSVAKVFITLIRFNLLARAGQAAVCGSWIQAGGLVQI